MNQPESNQPEPALFDDAPLPEPMDDVPPPPEEDAPPAGYEELLALMNDGAHGGNASASPCLLYTSDAADE